MAKRPIMELACGLLLLLASSRFADAGTCTGDDTSPVYDGMNCAEITSHYSKGTFCNPVNAFAWKEKCCASHADICESFTCRTSGEKINIDKICDKSKDCADGSDEQVCYQCHDGGLIPNNDLCNTETECADGSDEGEGVCITCKGNQRYAFTYICDGDKDCEDDFDETGCEGDGDVPGDYVVETLVVVDPESQKPYLLENNNDKDKAQKSILKDIDYYLTESNKHYANFFESDFKMRLSKAKVILLEEDIFSAIRLPANEAGRPRADGGTAMDLIREYLRNTEAYAKYKYDHATFLTGYDLGYPDTDKWTVLGKAWTGKVCDTQGSSMSVVEWSGHYQMVTVLVHEIGHSLGSGHDPDTVTGYIMSSTAGHTKERWWFSVLSRRDINNNIRKLNKMKNNCLTEVDSPAGYDIPDVEITAAMADPNVLCTRDQGQGWHYWPNPGSWEGTGNPKGDFLCNAILCHTAAKDKYAWTYASDGMPCGKHKACNEGKCKASTSEVAMKANNEECLFGDLHVEGYCEGLVKDDLAGFCESAYQKRLCCASAAEHCNKGPGHCYGDLKEAWGTKSCEESMDQLGRTRFCFNDQLFEKACCKSWEKYCTGEFVCYGDERVVECDKKMEARERSRFCANSYYEERCCATWARNCTGPFVCYADERNAFNGESCDAYIARRGVGTFCYNPQIFKERCCKSWEQHCSSTERSLMRRLIDVLGRSVHGQHGLRKLRPGVEEERERKMERELDDLPKIMPNHKRKRFHQKRDPVHVSTLIDEIDDERELNVMRKENTQPVVVEVDPNIQTEVEPPVQQAVGDRRRGATTRPVVVEVDPNIQEEIEPPVEEADEDR